MAGGEAAFAGILKRIDQAERSILVRCFEWRDDATGQMVAEALLRAADRGVEIKILKDRVGMAYEHLEGTKQSFFHKRIGLIPRLQTWSLMTVYGRWGSLRQKPSPLADALLNHQMVSVSHHQKRFDHAKLYVFDDEVVILGGMGIGDDFRHHNVDFMVEISGGGAAARLAERYEGRASFDPSRSFDYLLHSFKANKPKKGQRVALAKQRLALIASAQKRLTIEMAYFGDKACTAALIDAVKRGVQVTVLTAARANIIGDLNLWTCSQLLRRTRSPENLRIVLHPRMVHGKAIVGDGAWVDIGSTNFTSPSHGGYEEVDLFCRDAAFAKRVEDAIEHDIRDGKAAKLPIRYRRPYVVVERMLGSFHGRKKKSKVKGRNR
ncbi:MAG TPA: phosphatidylserine/phosphatidylglycerophosphate/cardiolipin synthase family protein [Polyangia bacterium]